MPCICARVASTICSGHPSPRAAAAIFSDVLAVLLTVFGGLDAPGGHRVKGCVHRLARLIGKSWSPHWIEIARVHFCVLALHGHLLSLTARTPLRRVL